MRRALCLAVALFSTAITPAYAASGAAPNRPAATARTADKPAPATKPAASATERDAAESRARNDARERAWDDKMKRTMRSICSGAQGC
jgi:hypothetical protein